MLLRLRTIGTGTVARAARRVLCSAAATPAATPPAATPMLRPVIASCAAVLAYDAFIGPVNMQQQSTISYKMAQATLRNVVGVPLYKMMVYAHAIPTGLMVGLAEALEIFDYKKEAGKVPGTLAACVPAAVFGSIGTVSSLGMLRQIFWGGGVHGSPVI